MSEVRVGDEIAFAPGAISFKLLSVAKKDGLVELRFGENPFDSFPETRRVILVRRPWPTGKTDYDMMGDVIAAAQRPGRFTSNRLAELREALDAYELGIPERGAADDVDPRVDESCGYLGGGFA